MNTPIKIYIAGKMSGMPNFNFDAFDKAEKELKFMGFSVHNPAKHGREWVKAHPDRQMSPDEYKRILQNCIVAVKQADAIFLLLGWENSKGARLELKTALEENKKIYLQEK